jgi:tRNA dimethylallyltransferase
MPPSPTAFADVLVLTGPTGSGKTALALDLAERFHGEIVAMDSMTLYRGLDIGTAKPTPAERARVPHHLIDVLDPWDSGNVAWWLEQAAQVCVGIRARGRRPLFVGGTPLYLKALVSGLFEAPPSDPAIRRRLEAEPPDQLYARLAAVDPATAGRLHPHDVRRVVRALEVWEGTGQPLSTFQQTWQTPSFRQTPAPTSPLKPQIPVAVLDWPRPELYRRIDARVDGMLAAGWLEEVRRLAASPRPLSQEASQALGYRELLAHLKGTGPDWEETVARIKTRTRQFAKRQLTWFRNMPGVVGVPADSSTVADQVARVWFPP